MKKAATKKPKPRTKEPMPLRLEWRSPAELAEHPKNWRRHPEEQISALTDILAEVGWAGALLYNERTERIIDGHARRRVALDQGSEKIPVLVGSWDEATDDGHGQHPTQKPVELFARPMLNHLKQGALAYEPFAGSGSQFVAAEQTRRVCYGMEIEPKYVGVCLERLAGMGLKSKVIP